MTALRAYRPLGLRPGQHAPWPGRHVVESGGCTWMLFAATETNRRRPYEAVFPEALEANLEHHRPVLPAGERRAVPGDTSALWVSEIGKQLETGALAHRVSMPGVKVFGRSMPPYWPRDAAATSIPIPRVPAQAL